MEHIAALLLIIGCPGGDMAKCHELPSPVTVFETMDDCQVQLPISTKSFAAKYSKLYSACLDVDPAMEEEDAELVWNISPEGKLVAAVEATGGSQVALAANAHTQQQQ